MHGLIRILKNWNGIPKHSVGVIVERALETARVNFIGPDRIEYVPWDFVVEFDLGTKDDSHRVCATCHRYLPIKNFKPNRTTADGRIVRRPHCKDCQKEIDRKPVSSKDRKEWNESKPPNYQVWECPICGKKLIPGLTCIPNLDHDHKTGKVRGWVCGTCNTGMGKFNDSPGMLKRAMDWIKRMQT
jgi:hypothetical protein